MSHPFSPLKGLLLVAVLGAVLSGCTVGLPPTGVTETGVTLNGYVTANTAGEVSYWFLFNGRERAHHTISLARDEGRRVSDPVEGLNPTSTYQWELCSQQQPDDGVCTAPQTLRTADAPICGQSLTQNLTLDRDVTCSGPVGLRIAADGLTVDLNGHSVTVIDPRWEQPVVEQFTVVDVQGHNGTTIRNGTLSYCCTRRGVGPPGGSAVSLSGSDNVLQDLRTPGGLEVSGDRNRIADTWTYDPNEASLHVTGRHNTILRTTMLLDDGGHAGVIGGSHNRLVDSTALADQGGGVSIGGDHNTARKLDSTGSLEDALLLTGDRDRVVDSQIRSASSDQTVIIRGATNSTVRASTIETKTFHSGIEIEGSVGTRVLANTIAATISSPQFPPFDALHVAADSSNTLLRLNTVTGASDDGIDTDSATTTFDRNKANYNGDLGIEAVPGVTDLGGNTASGNGNPLQCQNVFCLPG